MSDLRIKLIEMEGFRSFREASATELPESGATLIRGHYVGSAVGSGSGKSSIVLAAAYALGFSAPPSTELKNWYSKKMRVRVVLSDGTNEYEIVREPKLKVKGPNGEISGTTAEEEIDKILGVNRTLAESLTYRAQRKPGQFLSATDAEKKEFLSKILGLEELEKAHEHFSNELGTVRTRRANLQSTIEALRTGSDGELDRLTQEMEHAQVAYDLAVRESNDKAISGEQIAALKQTIALHEGELYKLMQVRNKVVSAQSENRTLRDQMVALKASIESLEHSSCPTCRREWLESATLLESQKAKLQEMVARFQSNAALEKNALPMFEQEPELRSKVSIAQGQIGQLSAPAAAARQQVGLAQQYLNSATSQLNQAKARVAQLSSYEASAATMERQEKVLAHQAELTGRNGFMGSIFDEVLADIQSRTNEMMAAIPNVSRFTISLSSVATMKNGNTKRSISVKLFCDGEDISAASVSGGQRCAIELCLDLAVSQSVRARSGCKLGWIVLDEAMDGLDSETKQAALEVVTRTIGGQVVVIDHATEVQEGFAKVVEVSFDGRDSTIV